MRITGPLTITQAAFIFYHYEGKTLNELADDLKLNSVYKVSRFLVDNGLKRHELELTEAQKQFVRDNYRLLTESQLARKFDLKSRFLIQKFKRRENLTIYRTCPVLKSVIKGEFFNVDELDWAI